MGRRALRGRPPRQPELWPGPTDLEGYQPSTNHAQAAQKLTDGARSLDRSLTLATEILAESRRMILELRNRYHVDLQESDE